MAHNSPLGRAKLPSYALRNRLTLPQRLYLSLVSAKRWKVVLGTLVIMWLISPLIETPLQDLQEKGVVHLVGLFPIAPLNFCYHMGESLGKTIHTMEWKGVGYVISSMGTLFFHSSLLAANLVGLLLLALAVTRKTANLHRFVTKIGGTEVNKALSLLYLAAFLGMSTTALALHFGSTGTTGPIKDILAGLGFPIVAAVIWAFIGGACASFGWIGILARLVSSRTFDVLWWGSFWICFWSASAGFCVSLYG